jgi:hypothetical protein
MYDARLTPVHSDCWNCVSARPHVPVDRGDVQQSLPVAREFPTQLVDEFALPADLAPGRRAAPVAGALRGVGVVAVRLGGQAGEVLVAGSVTSSGNWLARCRGTPETGTGDATRRPKPW